MGRALNNLGIGFTSSQGRVSYAAD